MLGQILGVKKFCHRIYKSKIMPNYEFTRIPRILIVLFLFFTFSFLIFNFVDGASTVGMTLASPIDIGPVVLNQPIQPVDLNPHLKGGTPPYKWSIASGKLPDGISLSGDGAIRDTPKRLGDYQATIKVTDSAKPPQFTTTQINMTVVLGGQQGGGGAGGGQGGQGGGAGGQTQPTFQLPSGAPITLSELEARIDRIARVLIRLSVIVLVIVLIWSGIAYATAGTNTKRLEYAKNTFKYGVIGALIILGVGVILRTIAALVTRNIFY